MCFVRKLEVLKVYLPSTGRKTQEGNHEKIRESASLLRDGSTNGPSQTGIQAQNSRSKSMFP